ncbi:MAG: hypothetical protein ACRD2Z_17110 [Thermoanaerobaculia bacterium]
MLFWTALLAAAIPAVLDFLKSDTGQQMMAGHQQMMGGLLQNLFGGEGSGGPLGGLLGNLFGARQNAAGTALQSLFPSPLQGGNPVGGLLGGLFGAGQ